MKRANPEEMEQIARICRPLGDLVKYFLDEGIEPRLMFQVLMRIAVTVCYHSAMNRGQVPEIISNTVNYELGRLDRKHKKK